MTREDLYASNVIKSFLPKGVKLEDCEYTKINWREDQTQNASRKPLEGHW